MSTAIQQDRQQADSKTAIRPFQVSFPEEELADLRRRVSATRWPDKETVPDHTQGVKLLTSQKLARRWSTEYDWRACEARLNALPHFMTEIDGLDIHFIHVRSKHPNALPLIVIHGWPGSIIEQLKIVGPLTDPTAFGGRAEDAFDLVIPSMPGFGFSGKPVAAGWGPDRMARAFIVLMKRLGYTGFVAQGGDWGGLIVDLMGVEAPTELLGIHTNFPGALPADVDQGTQTGAPAPSSLADDERREYDRLVRVWHQVYYAFYMASRPQTLAGLADSPIGLASFLLDHDVRSQEQISALFVDGTPFGDITQDDILDNITLYWLTNTAISAARIYWENKFGFFNPKGVKIAVAVSAFPGELYQCPESWAERAYPKLIHYNKLDKGGHFAAWEQPQLFSEEMRAAFRSLR